MTYSFISNFSIVQQIISLVKVEQQPALMTPRSVTVPITVQMGVTKRRLMPLVHHHTFVVQHVVSNIWKENLSSDGQQFHQYQPPLTVMVNNSTNIKKRTTTSHINSLNIIKTTIYDVWNPGTGLWEAQKHGGLNRLMRSG